MRSGREPWPGAVEPKVLIDEVLARSARPVLAAAGFSGSRRIWRRRPSEGLTQVVDAQASPWNRVARDWVEQTSASFTFDVGIHLRDLDERVGRPAPRGVPSPSACHVSVRIGELLDGGDRWWALATAAEVDRVAAAVTTALEEGALPWLDALSTVTAVRRSIDALPPGAVGQDVRTEVMRLPD